MDRRLLQINIWVARSDTLHQLERFLGVKHKKNCGLRSGPETPPAPCDCGAFQGINLGERTPE